MRTTLEGYYAACDEHGLPDRCLWRFIEPKKITIISATLAYFVGADGDKWYFIPVRIPDTEFTIVS